MEHHNGSQQEPMNETRPEAPQGRPDRILPISILIAAVMVAGALIFTTVYKGGGAPQGGAAQDPGTTAAGPTDASATAALALGPRDAILGNADAPVTIIEYGDYQCPFCTRYFSTIEPQLVQNYVNTGKAKMVFRNYAFLGAESIAAAQAAECAEDQNKLWAYHDALYTAKMNDENNGGGENDGLFTRALFMSIAGRLGMDTSAFGSCIDSKKYANLVSQEQVAAGQAGVQSTPTTFVNGTMVTVNGGSAGADPTAVLNAVAAAVAAAHK